jgi:hypothetical protein
MPRLIDAAAISVGLLLGVIISTLNLITLLVTDDQQAQQFCRFTENLIGIPMKFIVVVKILNLCLVFVLPFLVTVASNVMMLVGLHMSRKPTMNTHGRDNSRKHFSWMFLIISSVIIIFVLAKPITELLLAVKTFNSGQLSGVDYKGIIAEGMLWNLTTLTYMLVSLAGITYSPQTEK